MCYKAKEIKNNIMYNTNLDSDPASIDRVKGDALLCGDRVGLQSRGVLTKKTKAMQ